MNVPEQQVYLDNNATTRPAPECVAAMAACLQGDWGNPSSKHGRGQRAKQRVLEARGQVARLLGAQPAEIVFTGGATEANHAAMLGAVRLDPQRRHIVASAVEHPSTLLLLRHLEAQGRAAVTLLPVDRLGRLDLADLERAVTPGTALVSLMWANNETGVLFPIEQAAALARARGALFHSDAVQATGKVVIDLARVPLDLLSLSGHKLHGPQGIGALFVRKGLRWPPLLFGHQERGRRGGTENVPAIGGLGVASALAAQWLGDGGAAGMEAMRDHLEQGILARLPCATVNGGGAERVANTANIRFAGLDAEAILDKLDRAGIYASAGSACAAGGSEPSHVLSAMGLDRSGAAASIRFSLSRYTTRADIDRVLEVLPAVVKVAGAVAA